MTTRTTGYTEAAASAAPPGKRYNGVILALLGVVVAVVFTWIGYSLTTGGYFIAAGLVATGAILIGAVLLVAGVVIAPRDADYNRVGFPRDLDRWTRSWQCQRCGTDFVLQDLVFRPCGARAVG